MKKRTKMLLAVLCSVFAVFVVLCVAFFVFICGSYTRMSLDIYEELCIEQEILPELNELGEYSDVKFRHFHQNMAVFSCDSYTLKVIYDDKNYELQKNLLDSTYMFQSDPIEDSENEYIEHCFTYDGYDFRFLSLRNYSQLDYPKKICLIGTNDEKNTIAYLYFEDTDLDSIGSYEDFMEDYCNWK